MYVMADFICMGPLEQLGTQSKWKIRTEKFLLTVEFKPGVSRHGDMSSWNESRAGKSRSCLPDKRENRFQDFYRFLSFFFKKLNISAHFHAIPIHHVKCFFLSFVVSTERKTLNALAVNKIYEIKYT